MKFKRSLAGLIATVLLTTTLLSTLLISVNVSIAADADPDVLAYEGFETVDGSDAVALSAATTTGYGWADKWNAADGNWARKHNYTIYSGAALDYAFKGEGKIVICLAVLLGCH